MKKLIIIGVFLAPLSCLSQVYIGVNTGYALNTTSRENYSPAGALPVGGELGYQTQGIFRFGFEYSTNILSPKWTNKDQFTGEERVTEYGRQQSMMFTFGLNTLVDSYTSAGFQLRGGFGYALFTQEIFTPNDELVETMEFSPNFTFMGELGVPFYVGENLVMSVGYRFQYFNHSFTDENDVLIAEMPIYRHYLSIGLEYWFSN